MGIDFSGFRFLRYCKNNGVDFENVCQIGRQNCFFSSKEAEVEYGDFAEPLFRFLGAKNVGSVDYSDYQNASIIHDMNQPVSENLKERFSVVIDGGTLEHVFNYPTAIKNCMEMVKTGGHLILITPANNYFGHGFYQFSPELFFSLLNEQNGFAQTQIFIKDDFLQWHKIKNPREIKSRVDICCAENNESLIYVASKKISAVPEKLTVLQSDYVDLWQNGEKPVSGTNAKWCGNGMGYTIKSFVKKFIPNVILCSIRKSKFKKLQNAKRSTFYERINFNDSMGG